MALTDNFVTLRKDLFAYKPIITGVAGQGTTDYEWTTDDESQCTKNSGEYKTGDGIPKQSTRKRSKDFELSTYRCQATCSDDEQLGKDGAWGWSLESPPITESPPIPTRHDAKVTKQNKKRQDTARSDLRKLKLALQLNFGGIKEEGDTTGDCHGKGVVTFAQGLFSAEITRLHRSNQQDFRNFTRRTSSGKRSFKGKLC